jgi:hypothetical protein
MAGDGVGVVAGDGVGIISGGGVGVASCANDAASPNEKSVAIVKMTTATDRRLRMISTPVMCPQSPTVDSLA